MKIFILLMFGLVLSDRHGYADGNADLSPSDNDGWFDFQEFRLLSFEERVVVAAVVGFAVVGVCTVLGKIGDFERGLLFAVLMDVFTRILRRFLRRYRWIYFVDERLDILSDLFESNLMVIFLIYP